MSIYEITLVERDTYLSQIESQLAEKRKLLLNKNKILDETMKQNQFLTGIKNDYQNYHNHIIKQKQDQLKAMDILNQYIQGLTNSGKITDHDIKKGKDDQNKILREIQLIKSDLDDIIQQ
jgi:hypothetical protein